MIHSSLVSNLLTDLPHLLSQHKKELADHVAGAEVVQRRCAEREARADRTDTQVRERRVKGNSRVHIRWDDDYVREGETNITEERILVSKWN